MQELLAATLDFDTLGVEIDELRLLNHIRQTETSDDEEGDSGDEEEGDSGDKEEGESLNLAPNPAYTLPPQPSSPRRLSTPYAGTSLDLPGP